MSILMLGVTVFASMTTKSRAQEVMAADFKNACESQSHYVYLEDKCYSLSVSRVSRFISNTVRHLFSRVKNTMKMQSNTATMGARQHLELDVWQYCRLTE